MFNPKAIAEKAWAWISPKMPEGNELLEHAKQVGANATQDTTVVMTAIEKYFTTKGKGGVLESNNIWQSLKGKSPDEVIPHLKKCGKNSGKMDFILNLLSGGK